MAQGEARKGGSASGRREGVTRQKQGMELAVVHRLSGGRWTGQARGVLWRAAWVVLPVGEETWFCGISSVRPGEPQLDAPGLGLLWAGGWLCDDPGGPEGAEQEMVWVSLRPEGGYVLVRWGCSLQGLGKGPLTRLRALDRRISPRGEPGEGQCWEQVLTLGHEGKVALPR